MEKLKLCAIGADVRGAKAVKDEAEAALKRALDIDPQYTIAKDNLAMLSESRRLGPPAMVRINQPFKDSKIKQSITVIRE